MGQRNRVPDSTHLQQFHLVESRQSSSSYTFSNRHEGYHQGGMDKHTAISPSAEENPMVFEEATVTD
jgi:hypothetical protein